MHIMIYKYLRAYKKLDFMIEGAQTWRGKAFATTVAAGQAALGQRLALGVSIRRRR